MATADFQTCAKQFDASEVLVRLVMMVRVAGRLSLSTLADTQARALFLMGYA